MPPAPSADIAAGVPEVVVALDPSGSTIATYRPGGRGTWTCRYYELRATSTSAPPGSADLEKGPISPEPEQLVFLICNDSNGTMRLSRVFQWTPANPFGDYDAPRRAAQLARDRLPLPDPIAASAPPPGSQHLVGIATWFWTDTPWTPLTASATLAGVTATVTATPVALDIDLGDGSPTLSCPDGGTPYDTARPDANQTSTCTHVYRYRSIHEPDGTYPTTLTITWRITWTATSGASGDLGTLTRTTSAPTTVVDAEALIGT